MLINQPPGRHNQPGIFNFNETFFVVEVVNLIFLKKQTKSLNYFIIYLNLSDFSK